MTKDRWEKVIEKLEDGFPDFEKYESELSDESGGTKEVVEFTSPMGKVKLEFVTKPRLLGEKTSYSNRVGSDVRVEKQYDPDETVSYMNAYKQDVSGEWEQIDAATFE